MDILTYSLSKKYVDTIISNLPRGIIYKGQVNTVNDLPTSGNELGDAWTVKNTGFEYLWGNYEGQLQWIELGEHAVQNLKDGTTYGSIYQITNSTISPYAIATGYNSVAGSKCFNLLSQDIQNKTYTLSSTAGLAIGDIYSIYIAYEDGYDIGSLVDNMQNLLGTITNISGNTIAVETNNMFEIDFEHIDVCYFMIYGKPSIGDTDYGEVAYAEGFNTTASGIHSHAEGRMTKSYGRVSHAEGIRTIAVGSMSHAEGLDTQSIAGASHAEGGLSVTRGTYSHAEGYNTVTNGDMTHAEGNGTQANGKNSHAEGWHTVSAGESSHAEGSQTTTSEQFAHAEGNNTKANGSASHSEGYNTTASGSQSHAEGYSSKATGNRSHAEGYLTEAVGDRSHAEGRETKAIAENSHTEGWGTIAKCGSSHVEGKFNIEDNNYKYAHIIGNGTSNDARSNAHTIDWSGNGWFAGKVEGTNIGNITSLTTADKTNLVSAINEVNTAVGNVDTKASTNENHIGTLNNLDTTAKTDLVAAINEVNAAAASSNINIENGTGTNSIQQKTNRAIGYGAFAIGSGTTAGIKGYEIISTTLNPKAYVLSDATGLEINDTYSICVVSSGYVEKIYSKGTIVDINNNTISVDDDIVPIDIDEYGVFCVLDKPTIGDTTLGTSAFAQGAMTIAAASNSYAEGFETKALGWNAHTEGDASVASGISSHAEGQSTASGNYAHAENQSIASGKYAHSEGQSIASGTNSHSEGRSTKATGADSHAEGYLSQATGAQAHAEGSNSKAQGSYSHAEGNSTTGGNAIGAHSEGIGTNALGQMSHTEGNQTKTNATGSHAEGIGTNTAATASYAHAEGGYTIATGQYSHVQGKYNVEDTAKIYAHIVGNGTSTNARSNAHTLDWSGNAWFAGKVEGTNIGDITTLRTDNKTNLVSAINEIAVVHKSTLDTPIQNNTIYDLGTVSTLDIQYPTSDNFDAAIRFTTAASGTITISLPQSSKYIGAIPVFDNNEEWEVSISNGYVAAARVVSNA